MDHVDQPSTRRFCRWHWGYVFASVDDPLDDAEPFEVFEPADDGE